MKLCCTYCGTPFILHPFVHQKVPSWFLLCNALCIYYIAMQDTNVVCVLKKVKGMGCIRSKSREKKTYKCSTCHHFLARNLYFLPRAHCASKSNIFRNFLVGSSKRAWLRYERVLFTQNRHFGVIVFVSPKSVGIDYGNGWRIENVEMHFVYNKLHKYISIYRDLARRKGLMAGPLI